MKLVFNPIEKELIKEKVNQLLNGTADENLVLKSRGSLGKAIKMHEEKDIYNKVDSILKSMEKQDLVTTFNNSEILYSEKEKIQEILEYITISLYNTKELNKLNCIKYIEETKKRINSNCNYDMCIDYLLMKMHSEMSL